MKTYRGTRLNTNTKRPGDPVVTVNGRPLHNPKSHVVDSLEWAYAGSFYLSFAILFDCLGDAERVESLYRPFRALVGLDLPLTGWTLTEQQVLDAVAEIEPPNPTTNAHYLLHPYSSCRQPRCYGQADPHNALTVKEHLDLALAGGQICHNRVLKPPTHYARERPGLGRNRF